MLNKVEKILLYLYALLIPSITATRFDGFSLGRGMVLLLVAVNLFDFVYNRKTIIISRKIIGIVALYVFWMVASLLWTPDSCLEQGLIRTLFTIVVCSFYLLICGKGVTESEFSIIKNNIMIGGVLSALLLIIFGGNYYGDEEEVRYSLTSSTDPNFYSMYLITPIAIAYNKMRLNDGKNKIKFTVYMLLMSYTIIICGSRGALLALGIMGLIELLRRKKYIVIGIIILGIYLGFESVGEIYPRFEISELAKGAGRSFIWAVIAEMIKDNFIFGVGVSGIKGTYDDYAIQAGIGFLVGHGRDPHNAYMEILAELGIIGFSLYMGIVLYSLCNNYKKHSEDMTVGVIGTLVAATFLTSVLEEPIWFYFALLAMKSKSIKNNVA